MRSSRRKVVRNRREFDALSAREKETRVRVFEALSIARRLGLSLSAAAREADTTVATVRRYAGRSVERLPSGRYRVLADDREYRLLKVISTEGPLLADVRGSKAARLASEHANAVAEYGRRGDPDVLERFRGRKVGGFLLAVDPELLAGFAAAGELDAFDLYEHAS